MNYGLPGTPAADKTCMQSAEDAGSPPETRRGPSRPTSSQAWESLLFSDHTVK